MKNTTTPLILITNDDGFQSRGISLLADIMSQLGNVIIVAPQTQMSGQSHSISVSHPITFQKIEHKYECYAVNGTPVDCVKLAFNKILAQKPDLLVAGINHGCNASINTIYSGTMAATFEGCAENLPSIGFSLDSHDPEANLNYTKPYIHKIAEEVLEGGLEDNTCLNVNFPAGKINGVKVCHQAKAHWKEEFIADRSGNGGWWLNGLYKLTDDSPSADYRALQDGFTAITPMQVDFTAYSVMEKYARRFNQF
jgi:5'-nucleotidase